MVSIFPQLLLKLKRGPIVEEFNYDSLDNQTKVFWMNGHLSLNGEQLKNTVDVKNCYGLAPSTPDLLNQFVSAFESLFSHVYYLGPTRVHPQRRYHWNGKHPKDIGPWGDKAIHALLSARLQNFKNSLQ